VLLEIKSEPSRRVDYPKRTLVLRCDACQRTFEKRFFQHIAGASVHACSRKCQGTLQHKGGALDVKKRERFVERYGVDNPLKDASIRRRVRATNVERYGVPVSSQAESVKEKARATNQEKFGVDWHTQSANFDEKARATWFENYGVDHPAKSPVMQERYRATNMERYGVPHVLMLPEVHRAGVEAAHTPEAREKALDSMKANGTIGRQISMAEERFGQLLIERFGQEDVEAQVWVNGWRIDFYVKSLRTYVQFDGVYWHGLDRPLHVLQESQEERDKAILGTRERDRAQDSWFAGQGLRLVRVTDLELKWDPAACLARVANA